MPNQTPPQNKSDVVAFFEELWERLVSGTPKFFKIIRNIALAVIAIAGIAEGIQKAGVVLPEWLDRYVNWTLIAGAVATAIIAQLPTTDKDRKVVDGELPFTAKKVSEGKEPLH